MSFVCEHRDRFGVEPILRVLEVPTSTFYGWVAQRRDPCQRRRQDAWLLGKIRAVHGRSRQTYGAPRVHAQLHRDGVGVSRKRVARLMAAHGLQGAVVRRRWRCSTRQDPRRRQRPAWSTATSPRRRPTGCGSPTSRGSRPGRGRCGWPASATPSPGGSWAARPATGPMSSWCWARWSTPSGAVTWTVIPPSAGSSIIRIGARSTPRSGSPNGWRMPAFAPRWARSATASTPPWPRPSCSTLKVELVYRTSFRTREEAELYRRLVQPPPHPAGARLAQPRRVRGRLLHPAGRPTRVVYHPVRPTGRQVAHPPENRGNLTLRRQDSVSRTCPGGRAVARSSRAWVCHGSSSTHAHQRLNAQPRYPGYVAWPAANPSGPARSYTWLTSSLSTMTWSSVHRMRPADARPVSTQPNVDRCQAGPTPGPHWTVLKNGKETSLAHPHSRWSPHRQPSGPFRLADRAGHVTASHVLWPFALCGTAIVRRVDGRRLGCTDANSAGWL
jgi:hypothetical protein